MKNVIKQIIAVANEIIYDIGYVEMQKKGYVD